MQAVKTTEQNDPLYILTQYSPSGNIRVLNINTATAPPDSIHMGIQEEGTHMLTLAVRAMQIRTRLDTMRQWIAESGQPENDLYTKEPDSYRQVEYLQYSKTIFQAGGSGVLTDACTHPAGLAFEIVPEENPYQVPDRILRPEQMKVRFRVFLNDQPLANAFVRCWHEEKGKMILTDSAHTNEKGYITLYRKPGISRLSCMYLAGANDRAVRQFYHTDLSFEYSRFFPEGRK